MTTQVVQITAGTGTKILTNEVTTTVQGSSQTVEQQVIAIGDPTTIGNMATVKAAAAAAASGDSSLVVAVHPNTPLPAGTNALGTVAAPAITKGTQGSTGFAVQSLHDAGRNLTTFHMVLPVLMTATDALQSLASYKSGAAVASTTTPAVVTAGKILRISSVVMLFIETATIGGVRATLRANTGGVVAITSPAVATWILGGTAATAGVMQSLAIDIPGGFEFAAGTGIGISMAGIGATAALAAVGYGQISLHGYEY